ncbi:hypothetical protein QTP88_022847 [Uroleucon formosanum]
MPNPSEFHSTVFLYNMYAPPPWSVQQEATYCNTCRTIRVGPTAERGRGSRTTTTRTTKGLTRWFELGVWTRPTCPNTIQTLKTSKLEVWPNLQACGEACIVHSKPPLLLAVQGSLLNDYCNLIFFL